MYEIDNLVNQGWSMIAMTTTIEKKGGKMKLPSNEQAVVDEFTTVIRKHQDQTPGTLARSTITATC